MSKIISCCGVVCSECERYPENCKGCPAIKGKVFWLEYTGENICPVYSCCMLEKKYEHCGKCALLPCEKYHRGDPTKTKEENQQVLEKQLALLNEL
jgi:hypothetical protein